jgi:hypothetical protein
MTTGSNRCRSKQRCVFACSPTQSVGERRVRPHHRQPLVSDFENVSSLHGEHLIVKQQTNLLPQRAQRPQTKNLLCCSKKARIFFSVVLCILWGESCSCNRGKGASPGRSTDPSRDLLPSDPHTMSIRLQKVSYRMPSNSPPVCHTPPVTGARAPCPAIRTTLKLLRSHSRSPRISVSVGTCVTCKFEVLTISSVAGLSRPSSQ